MWMQSNQTALLLCILLLKMLTVFSGQPLNPIQTEKTVTCPFNAFFLPLLRGHLEDRSTEVYCSGSGRRAPASLRIAIQPPWVFQDKQGCCVPSAAGFPSTCLLPTCSQAPMQVWDGISVRGALGGGVSWEEGGVWHIQDEMSRCREWEQRNKKQRRKRRGKAGARTHAGQ